jgi:hypothetical protein
MARLTHSIGGVSFGAINSTDLRQSLGCFADNEEYQVHAFHPPGANGNVTIWAGRQGQQVRATQKYVGSAAAVLSAYKADREAWAPAPVSITDSGGTEFLRCRMVRMSVTKPCTPVGPGGVCFMETQAVFTRDS